MPKKMEKRLKFIIDVAYMAIVAGIIYVIGKYAISLVMPFIIALILVITVRPIIKFISDRININQKVISPIIVGVLYILLVSALLWLITRVVIMTGNALTGLPAYYQNVILPAIIKLLDQFQHLLKDIPSTWQIDFDVLQQSITSAVQKVVVNISQRGIETATDITNSIPAVMMNLIFTIMLSFFISIHYEMVIKFFNAQMPDKVKSLIADLKIIFKDTVFKYIRAAIILMFITLVELAVGLIILKQPNAIIIALGIAVFDALPFFGTGAIMIPWIMIELLQGNYSFALELGILYGIVTLIRSILEPKIVGDQLGLNPIASLMAVYVGYRLFGVLGMIAFPILLQTLLALHKGGKIHLYKEAPVPVETEEEQE